MKRAYRSANKLRDGGVDEDSEDEDEDAKKLTGDGKEMKKLVRNLDKNNAYDSDEDKNPYLTSVSRSRTALTARSLGITG